METTFLIILWVVTLLFVVVVTFILVGFACMLWDVIVNQKIFSKMARRSKQ
jgi:hypothetical protein